MKLFARIILFRVFLRPFLGLVIGVKFPKPQCFPRGKFLLVANHNSHLDTVSLMCSLPVSRLSDVHPAAAADYFARNKAFAFFFEYFLNTIFVRRKGEKKELKPLDELDMHIKSGKSLILFPEGTRGQPEHIADFKHGAALLLQKNPDLQLVPVFMIGMGKAMPRGDGFIIPTECEIRVGRCNLNDSIRSLPVAEFTSFIQNEVLKLKQANS
ncbi:MAG: lysophospholipid acyltransferase family protein [Bacteriovoracia bacterium]